MSRLSITGASDDYLIKIKRITKKFIEKHGIAPKKDLGPDPDQRVLDDLFYALCGLSTTCIRVFDDRVEMHPEYRKPHLLKSFEALILNHTRLAAFVRQAEYSGDFMRREVARIVDARVADYLSAVTRAQGAPLEALYVAMQPFMYDFEELGILATESTGLFGAALLDFLVRRRDRTVSFPFYAEMIAACLSRYELEIGAFVFLGTVESDDFMIIKKRNFQFDECEWTDGYKINKQAMPEKFAGDAKNILEAGKIVRILNKIEKCDRESFKLKMERIGKYYEALESCSEDFQGYNLELKNNPTVKNNSGLKNASISKNNSNHDYTFKNNTKNNPDTEDERENPTDCLLVPKRPGDFLKNFKFSSIALEKYLNEQKSYFNSKIISSLAKEWEIIKMYILQIDSSFISEFFDDIGDILFLHDTSLLRKIQTPPQIELFLADSTLASHLRRILSMRSAGPEDDTLGILNTLAVRYKPCATFRLFFPQKTLSELELIFRFLYTLNAINYRFSRIAAGGNAFASIVLDFNTYLLASLFVPTITAQLDFHFETFDAFVANLHVLCRKCLRDLFLTSQRVFEVFAEYFDLCLLQTDYKEFGVNNILEIIGRLCEEIEKENGNNFLLLQLERFRKR